jgi:hypothetical protein
MLHLIGAEQFCAQWHVDGLRSVPRAISNPRRKVDQVLGDGRSSAIHVTRRLVCGDRSARAGNLSVAEVVRRPFDVAKIGGYLGIRFWMAL